MEVPPSLGRLTLDRSTLVSIKAIGVGMVGGVAARNPRGKVEAGSEVVFLLSRASHRTSALGTRGA